MNIDVHKLKEFLAEAKKRTYAGNGNPVGLSRPGSKDLPYREGDFYYLDSYLGNFNFIGEEAVWYKDEIIWGMNYYGEMLIDEIPEGFSDCLKSALREVSMESPYRGPKCFESGKFQYECDWDGSLESFYGSEEIYLEYKLIYRLVFHGGLLR